MDPSIISSIVSAAGSIAGAATNAAGAATANRRAYKWSKKYFDYQNQFNIENYSPAMQMERLRAAGLNPHLVTGTGNSVAGGMSVPDYQNPVDGNAVTNAVGQALGIYAQYRQLQNSTNISNADVELKKAARDKAEQETAKIAYYNSMIQPWEAVTAKNKSTITNYQIGRAKLENQKLFNDISMFALQKRKYQLGLDLLEIEKKYADEYQKYRNQSVRADSRIKSAEAGIRGLDLSNYQKFGLRPQDPYYLRIGTNILENVTGGSRFGKLLKKIFH